MQPSSYLDALQQGMLILSFERASFFLEVLLKTVALLIRIQLLELHTR